MAKTTLKAARATSTQTTGRRKGPGPEVSLPTSERFRELPWIQDEYDDSFDATRVSVPEHH